jgi:hypothetical protein
LARRLSGQDLVWDDRGGVAEVATLEGASPL